MEHENLSCIRLAPPTYRFNKQVYSMTWICDCAREGRLVTKNDVAEYRLKLAAKQGNTPFTPDDDKLL
jgi:hypothetical protein